MQKEDIKYIVVHCSASPNGRDDRARDIHRWHLDNGWSGIGYHKVVCVDGAIESGRPWYWQGAHSKPVNSNSVSVCMIGTDSFSERQYQSLGHVLEFYLQEFPNAVIAGHCEIEPERKAACPSQEVIDYLDNFFEKYRYQG